VKANELRSRLGLIYHFRGASQAPNSVSCDGRNISLSLDMQHHYKLNTCLNIDEENLPALAEITFTGCKQ